MKGTCHRAMMGVTVTAQDVSPRPVCVPMGDPLGWGVAVMLWGTPGPAPWW